MEFHYLLNFKNINNQKTHKKLSKYIKKFSIIFKIFILSLSLTTMILYKLLFNKNFFYKNFNLLPTYTYRLVFVFGTKLEAIKLIPLIKELKENKNFICISINTGQDKEIQQIMESFNMENSIDFNLYIMKKNQSLSKMASQTISKLEKIYNIINPNAVIVQGETIAGFAAAVSAFYQNIPIFHVEAGLRTHNLNFSFLEEFKMLSIDGISNLLFAPTDLAANNLLKENKNSSNIFITGNTIVDSLKLALNNNSPSQKIKKLIEKAKSLCIKRNDCKIILLFCHRSEKYFKYINNILNSIQKLLKDFNNIVIIFPFNLNSNIKQSIINAIPSFVYNDIINGKKIKNNDYIYLNRFLMIPQLNYFDLFYLESASYFIITDSDDIKEEGVAIEKPVLSLKESEDRTESIKSGNEALAGISLNKIYYFASLLLKNKELYYKMTKDKYIYGKGNSSIIISQIIKEYFHNKLQMNILNYSLILSQYDNSNHQISNLNLINNRNEQYDIVIVITVWKRKNLERQLFQVKNQSILKNKKTNIIIFQNSNHINVNEIIDKWKKSNKFSEKVDINFIQSPIETGYFGRFIVPLTSSVSSNSYFIICDDDVIWGRRYFENMLRVVDEGSLAVRTGRIIDKNFEEFTPASMAWNENIQVCYNVDINYDFGGHIWAGRIAWLRKAWNHIPISIENGEDFWISAALKSFYNIPTKAPKCPCPKGIPIEPDMCAASDKSAHLHINARIGDSIITHHIRAKIRKETTIKFNYQPLISSNPEYVQNISKNFVFGYLKNPLFNLSNPLWNDALYWQ